MTDPDYSTLALECAATADYITHLADQMEEAAFHADGWPPPMLRELANTLRGTAQRAAMAADDVPLLNELSGRRWTALHRHEGGPR